MYIVLFAIVLLIGLVLLFNRSHKKLIKEEQEKIAKSKQPQDTLKVRVKPKDETKPKTEVKVEEKPTEVQPEVKKSEIKEESKKPEVKKETLPECDYPDFEHTRLLEMGLSDGDAKEFVDDLINQIDDHIPKIQTAIDANDVEELEHLTHSIKGSSTNIGAGGIADLLTEFNTYIKSKSNTDVIKEYFRQLQVYFKKLKEQYS